MSIIAAGAAGRQKGTVGPLVRSLAALVAACVSVSCLLLGLSYPGFPVSTAACGVLAAAAAVALVVASGLRAAATGRGGPRAAATLVLVGLVLVGGAVAAQQDDGTRLSHRWARSKTAFEAAVAAAGPPLSVESSHGSGDDDRYPGQCPSRLGAFRIAECRSLDGGYLFLQAQEALSDDSGIMYLPQGPAASADWWNEETLVPLGGPWFSWTCSC